MNYDLTMEELLEIIQKSLDTLKGKNVTKEGGISKLVESAVDNIEDLSVVSYHIEVKECAIKMYCAGIDNEVKFAEVRPSYRADKRKWNGEGDVLESVTVKLTRDIPLDMNVLNVSQLLDYTVAKENFERLEREQTQLLEEYKNNYEAMKKLHEVMQTEAYDKETEKEAQRAEEILETAEKIQKCKNEQPLPIKKRGR